MAFNKKVGPGKKNPKLINEGPTSFSEFRVMNKKNYNSNWKKILGFRNMQEKLENHFFDSCMNSNFFGAKYLYLNCLRLSPHEIYS